MSNKRGRNDGRSVAHGKRQPGAHPPPPPPPLPPLPPPAVGIDRGAEGYPGPCPRCGADALWYGSIEGPDDELVTRCIECEACPWDYPPVAAES